MPKILLPAILLLFINCNHTSSSKNDLSGYYQEYLIDLGQNPALKVQCAATFRKGDKSAKPASLPKDYQLYLDDKPVPLAKDVSPDYTMELGRAGFAGDHVWKLKHKDETILEVPFTFSTFNLVDSVPTILDQQDISLNIQGLQDDRQLECWFYNTNIKNEQDKFSYNIWRNSIVIPAADTRKLKPGSYKLRISYIQIRPLQMNDKEIGKLDVRYILDDIPVEIK
jgi:hypothetical protein